MIKARSVRARRRFAAAAATTTAGSSTALLIGDLLAPDRMVAGGAEPGALLLGRYSAVRGAVLTAALVGPLAIRAWPLLRFGLFLNAAVQAGDVIVAAAGRRPWFQTLAPAGFAALDVTAAALLNDPS